MIVLNGPSVTGARADVERSQQMVGELVEVAGLDGDMADAHPPVDGRGDQVEGEFDVRVGR